MSVQASLGDPFANMRCIDPSTYILNTSLIVNAVAVVTTLVFDPATSFWMYEVVESASAAYHVFVAPEAIRQAGPAYAASVA